MPRPGRATSASWAAARRSRWSGSRARRSAAGSSATRRRGSRRQLADELAKIHAIPPERLPFLRGGDVLERFEHELDSVGDPHPAIEYGLWWLREHRPEPLPDVVSHGDFRIGNVVVSERGLEYLLDWEFAHLSDPREDLAWPIVRAWRFGADERAPRRGRRARARTSSATPS